MKNRLILKQHLLLQVLLVDINQFVMMDDG
jgi:hypothetical protein